MEKRHFVAANNSFYRQLHVNTHTYTRMHKHNKIQYINKTAEKGTKMASSKWKRYAMKKIKFNTFFCALFASRVCFLRSIFTLFNINYKLCVVCHVVLFIWFAGMCLSVCVCICLFLCDFSHLVFIFIQRLHHLA